MIAAYAFYALSVQHGLPTPLAFVVVLAVLQHLPQGQQARNFRHARQRGVQQRSNFFPAEERAVLNNVENAFAVALQEFLELALAVDLPDRQLPLRRLQPVWPRLLLGL